MEGKAKADFFSQAQKDQQWARRCKLEEDLLVDGFGRENNLADERKRLYELFLKKKAMGAVREFKPI